MAELNHTHFLYDNFVLQTEFENLYKSKLDLMKFVTVDNSLVGVAGDTIKVRVYTATEGTEVLAMGEGNTKNIEVSHEMKEYKIKLLQNRFPYYDEEAMKDPTVITEGLNGAVADMFNTVNAQCMAEFKKATLTSEYVTLDFDAIVDAVATFPNNESEELSIFGLVNPKDKATLRKNLKDDLKYIEAYVRTGYIGTVNGVNFYSSNIAEEGKPILATKEAVHYKNKVGSEVEQVRTDANKRLNDVYTRKYGAFYLKDATRVVKMVPKGAVSERVLQM